MPIHKVQVTKGKCDSIIYVLYKYLANLIKNIVESQYTNYFDTSFMNYLTCSLGIPETLFS